MLSISLFIEYHNAYCRYAECRGAILLGYLCCSPTCLCGRRWLLVKYLKYHQSDKARVELFARSKGTNLKLQR
jgi:hypothetical protein